ncbi:hypothetical protein [Bradyrhizobium erythrophlei]|uniref:Uncharacterized protein n=1 Tax=Bradyrhizobium erythrophlei TaxID=1437360 RepID=A0A1M5I9C9_9BRAD|nr:hypothetical protein [Bradyrhizobium erythrophlei]SHG24852.1 hypothetical protein SAMN05444169_1393 [Bradyrhizobium erythrophlei]
MTVNRKFSSADIALAFKATGGAKALIRWAKKPHNQARFYSMFKNEILQILQASHSNAPVENSQALSRAVLEVALRGAVSARARGDPPTSVTYTGGPHVDLNFGVVKRGVTSDVVGAAKQEHPLKPQPDPPMQPRPKPDVAAPAPQLTAAEARALALGPPNPPRPEGPSATELFLQYGNTARPTWSPSRSWSGS